MFAKLKAYINTTKCSKVPFHLPECTCGERDRYMHQWKRNSRFLLVLVVSISFLFKKSLFTPCKVEEPLKDIQFWEKEEEKDEKHLRKLTRKNPKITDAFNSKL